MLQLWAQPIIKGNPVDVGVLACHNFLFAYRKEVSAVRIAGDKGPRIDHFLQGYLLTVLSPTYAEVLITVVTQHPVTPNGAAQSAARAPAPAAFIKARPKKSAQIDQNKDSLMRQVNCSEVWRDHRGKPIVVSAADVGGYIAEATYINDNISATADVRTRPYILERKEKERVTLDPIDNFEREKERKANGRRITQEERRRRTIRDSLTGQEMILEQYFQVRDERIETALCKKYGINVATFGTSQQESTSKDNPKEETQVVEKKMGGE